LAPFPSFHQFAQKNCANSKEVASLAVFSHLTLLVFGNNSKKPSLVLGVRIVTCASGKVEARKKRVSGKLRAWHSFFVCRFPFPWLSPCFGWGVGVLFGFENIFIFFLNLSLGERFGWFNVCNPTGDRGKYALRQDRTWISMWKHRAYPVMTLWTRRREIACFLHSWSWGWGTTRRKINNKT